MRAFLVLLTLTLLPLFSAAASVLACCGHFQSSQAPETTYQRPGHGQAVEDIEEGVAGDSGFDLDCGICHANCTAAFGAISAPTTMSAGTERFKHLTQLISPHWHERPYRPQWSAPRVSGLNA